MKPKKKWQIIVAVVVLLGLGYYFYQRGQTTTGTTQYVTAPVEKGTLITSVSGSGNVAVDQIANVDPTIGGTVQNLSVAVGDRVKKGEVLFTIDNDQLGVSVDKSAASLEQTQNSIDTAVTTKHSAQADLAAARKKNKTTPGTYSKRQIDVLKEKVDNADAAISANEKDVTASQADLSNQRSIAAKRTVTAPISGTVSAVNVKNGDDLSKVSSGTTHQAPIIIGDLGTLEAVVSVNEVDIPQVSVGQKVTLTFPAIDNFSATGKVKQINSLGTISQRVVTYTVFVTFDSLDPRIKPQMSVSASIVTGEKSNVLLVPSGAVKMQGGQAMVQVLNSGTTPTTVSVEVGSSNATETEIISGLQAGDKVVTRTITPGATGATSGTTGGGGGGLRLPGLGGGRG